MSRNGGAMKASSDKMYDKFKDYDFTDAKPVAKTPHLASLQLDAGSKSRVTILETYMATHSTDVEKNSAPGSFESRKTKTESR